MDIRFGLSIMNLFTFRIVIWIFFPQVDFTKLLILIKQIERIIIANDKKKFLFKSKWNQDYN
jgi:hypothetical protein